MILIVLPRIQRVRSGEKVVLSAWLGASSSRLNSSPSLVRLNDGSTDTNVQEQANESASNNAEPAKRVQLKKDEPLPRRVEKKILGAQRMLREVTNKLYVVVSVS